MSHTPGPWEWKKLGGNWVLVADYGGRPVVVDADSDGWDSWVVTSVSGELIELIPEHPNARLLQAAPDLLYASEHAVVMLRTLAMQFPMLNENVTELQAAITKAGGTP